MQIDLSFIDTELQLHELLCMSFSLPEFYGMNWDAFWDCISDLSALPAAIEFINSRRLMEKLPMQFYKLKRCFLALLCEYPDLDCKVTWH